MGLLLGLGHFHLDGANLQIQTHLVPKIMHQNIAIILQQFNYSKNLFIVLVPGAGFDLIEHNNETNSSHKKSFCNLVDLIFYPASFSV